MENQLVSINTAKLAKEKKFGIFEECWYSGDILRYIEYPGDESLHDYFKFTEDEEDNTFPIDSHMYLAPTQALLQKWLREKHNIIVSIIPHFYGSYSSPTVKYRYKIMTHEDITEFDKYEDCLEMGLLEALNEIKTTNP